MQFYFQKKITKTLFFIFHQLMGIAKLNVDIFASSINKINKKEKQKEIDFWLLRFVDLS